jgi:hypothetical protein
LAGIQGAPPQEFLKILKMRSCPEGKGTGKRRINQQFASSSDPFLAERSQGEAIIQMGLCGQAIASSAPEITAARIML